MNFVLKTQTLAQAGQSKFDTLVVLLQDGDSVPSDQAVGTWINQVQQSGDLDDGVGAMAQGSHIAGVQVRRVCVLRVGDGSAGATKKALGAAVAVFRQKNTARAALVWLRDPQPLALRAAMLALADVTYLYTHTKPSATPYTLGTLTLVVPKAIGVQTAFEQGLAMVRGVTTAREWANRPANHATPTHLARAAQQFAKERQMSVQVLGPKEVEKLGMGAFMAVAQGSAEPLRFIVLQYQGASAKEAPVVLVGKGISFDTGGISIKPAPEMDEMKFDMGGAASVLGTFAAMAQLQPHINVVGLIPTCENMPDGRAVKPGDVVTSMSGQTIEILNTDAEGRLILCDALTYARRFKPKALIDIATLTGACVIALGGVRSGLFSTQDDLASALELAGASAGDLCWRMPLDEDYAEGLRSNFADMGNVAGRQAGAVTAAKFLQKFTTGMPWAHLDIAGTAWKSGAAKGGTGRPVPLLVQYLLDVALPAKRASQSQSKRETAGAAQGRAPAKASGKPSGLAKRKGSAAGTLAD